MNEEKLFRAVIDNAGIYRGVEQVAQYAEGDIPVPEDCSLKPGKYIWMADHGRFEPLPKSKQSAAPGVPSFEEALYALIKSTKKPPQVCLDWAAYFETTIGGR